VPDLLLGDAHDGAPAGVEEGLVPLPVALHVELAAVVSGAVDLDKDPQATIDEVDPSEPLVPARVDLALEWPLAGVREDAREPRLQPAGRGDVTAGALFEDCSHGADAVPAPFAQLLEQRMEAGQ
jgi:hypothetical protein